LLVLFDDPGVGLVLTHCLAQVLWPIIVACPSLVIVAGGHQLQKVFGHHLRPLPLTTAISKKKKYTFFQTQASRIFNIEFE
jgi:hypothetical protein